MDNNTIVSLYEEGTLWWEAHRIWHWGRASDSDVHNVSPIHPSLFPAVLAPYKTKQWPNCILFTNREDSSHNMNMLHMYILAWTHFMRIFRAIVRRTPSRSCDGRGKYMSVKVKKHLESPLLPTYRLYTHTFTCRLFSCCWILACAAFLSALAEGKNRRWGRVNRLLFYMQLRKVVYTLRFKTLRSVKKNYTLTKF